VTKLFREDLGNRLSWFSDEPRAKSYMWDSLAAAYLIDPGFVTKSETKNLDVEDVVGTFVRRDRAPRRRMAPEATPVTVMLQLDFKRVWSLCRDLLTRRD